MPPPATDTSPSSATAAAKGWWPPFGKALPVASSHRLSSTSTVGSSPMATVVPKAVMASTSCTPSANRPPWTGLGRVVQLTPSVDRQKWGRHSLPPEARMPWSLIDSDRTARSVAALRGSSFSGSAADAGSQVRPSGERHDRGTAVPPDPSSP
jgi:hypothetical protein